MSFIDRAYEFARNPKVLLTGASILAASELVACGPTQLPQTPETSHHLTLKTMPQRLSSRFVSSKGSRSLVELVCDLDPEALSFVNAQCDLSFSTAPLPSRGAIEVLKHTQTGSQVIVDIGTTPHRIHLELGRSVDVESDLDGDFHVTFDPNLEKQRLQFSVGPDEFGFPQFETAFFNGDRLFFDQRPQVEFAPKLPTKSG